MDKFLMCVSSQTTFLHSLAVFRKILSNNRLGSPFWVGTPPFGNSGCATVKERLAVQQKVHCSRNISLMVLTVKAQLPFFDKKSFQAVQKCGFPRYARRRDI